MAREAALHSDQSDVKLLVPKLAAFVASEEGLATLSLAGRKNLTNAR